MMWLGLLTCFILVANLPHSSENDADCLYNWINDNNIYILSDQPTTYQEAEETCQSYGGNLAQISSQDERRFFEPRLRSSYIPDSLTTVDILVDDRELYVFRSPQDTRSSTITLDGYGKPKTGELNSIMLYKSNVQGFNQRVDFCRFDFVSYNEHRDTIRSSCSRANNWPFNFRLQGGKSQTSKAIRMYNYVGNLGHGFTSKLRLNLFNNQSFNLVSPRYVYLPDISVFTGARSDVNQSNWFWNNGTMITDTTYPTSDTSICQQMTWPLTYDDGINLRAKECGLGESNYICRAKVSTVPSVEEVECDGNSLLISFLNKNDEVFLNGTIQVTISDRETLNISMGSSNVTIGNLTQRTNYSFQITPQFKGCSVGSTINVTGQTGYGVPDPVTSATVANSGSEHCLVSWRKENNTEEEISYMITSISNDTIKYTSVNLSSNHEEAQDLGEFMTYEIDLFGHGYDNNISFEIETVSSCGKMSESVVVNGTCISPMQPKSRPTGLSTSATIGIIVLVIAILILGLVFFIYRRNVHEQLNKCLHVSTRTYQGDTTEHSTAQEQNGFQEFSEPTFQNNLIPPQQSLSALGEIPESNYVNIGSLSTVIKARDFETALANLSATNFSSINRQYREIATLSLSNEPAHEIASKHKPKNRYRNIYPYDHALVPLHGGRYINASFIEGFEDPKRFIATQGPKTSTVTDFWEMIWTQDSSLIVMLCNCVEAAKIKCETYWPDLGLSHHFGSFEILGVSENICGDVISRKLKLKNAESGEERMLMQFQYTGWPDHGMPYTTTSLIKLRKLVIRANETNKGPIVVHCSAGVGRSGTFIAFDNLVQEANNNNQVDVMQAVLKMRMNRKNMVQNEGQYLFLHRILLESLVLPETEMNVPQFQSKMADPKWAGKQAAKELGLLSKEIVTTSIEMQNKKNASLPQYSSDELFVVSDNKVIPMGAHRVQSCYYPGIFIASSEPKRENEENFWKMVLMQKTRFIVALETMETNPFTLTAVKVGEIFCFGDITIKVGLSDRSASTMTHVFKISSKDNVEPVEVTHVFIHFHDNIISSSLQKVLNDIRISMKTNTMSKCLVCCRDGNNKTGLFLAVANLIEQIKCEEKIDVFRNVKDLRDYRRTLLNEKNCYKMCYIFLHEYLQSSDQH